MYSVVIFGNWEFWSLFSERRNERVPPPILGRQNNPWCRNLSAFLYLIYFLFTDLRRLTTIFPFGALLRTAHAIQACHPGGFERNCAFYAHYGAADLAS